jgi:coproporphyrinogen III oxidase
VSEALGDRAAAFYRELQGTIVEALERLDGGARFREDRWERPGGGGGVTRVLADGALLEKAGVNFSDVHGSVTDALAGQLRGEGAEFRATGVSLVLHPKNPYVPIVHANFRFLTRGGASWFGGGADLTPAYPFEEDVLHFHRTLKGACDRHDPTHHPRFKAWCDDYFTVKHRGEMRGVGGIFFDELPTTEANFAFQRDAGAAFLPAWLPIAERRRDTPWGERQKQWQLVRRGRYVEFNLVWDRGTTFGLKSHGRIESILMSLPPLAAWGYDHKPEPGSPEEAALAWFQPRALPL